MFINSCCNFQLRTGVILIGFLSIFSSFSLLIILTKIFGEMIRAETNANQAKALKIIAGILISFDIVDFVASILLVVATAKKINYLLTPWIGSTALAILIRVTWITLITQCFHLSNQKEYIEYGIQIVYNIAGICTDMYFGLVVISFWLENRLKTTTIATYVLNNS